MKDWDNQAVLWGWQDMTIQNRTGLRTSEVISICEIQNMKTNKHTPVRPVPVTNSVALSRLELSSQTSNCYILSTSGSMSLCHQHSDSQSSQWDRQGTLRQSFQNVPGTDLAAVSPSSAAWAASQRSWLCQPAGTWSPLPRCVHSKNEDTSFGQIHLAGRLINRTRSVGR